MKKLVWLTVHGEQKYEGMSADSSELRVRGTMETTKDGYLLRYEEADETGRVTTAPCACTGLRDSDAHGRGDERDGV